ncbi:hypothetical protein D9M70_603240 [compost metagenome]
MLCYRQFTEQTLQLMADRLLLATDWPHLALKDKTISTDQLWEMLLGWIPEDMRNRIIVDNPTRLYGF